MSALLVLVDGHPLPEEEARGLWRRFSLWMEEHPADLAGFARSEGFASVHPEMHAGVPALVASRSGPQRAYGPAPKRVASTSRPSPPTPPTAASKRRQKRR